MSNSRIFSIGYFVMAPFFLVFRVGTSGLAEANPALWIGGISAGFIGGFAAVAIFGDRK